MKNKASITVEVEEDESGGFDLRAKIDGEEHSYSWYLVQVLANVFEAITNDELGKTIMECVPISDKSKKQTTPLGSNEIH